MEVVHRGLNAGEFVHVVSGFVRRGPPRHADGQALQHSHWAQDRIHVVERLLSVGTVK